MARPTIATTAPLPDLRQLTGLLGASDAHDADLARPWTRDGDRSIPFSRAAWALYAAAAACAGVVGKRPTVWLPDYFCNQATLPVRRIADLVFYPITHALEPDWDACQGLADKQSPDMFVLVHYFGYPAAGLSARHFCDRNNAWLIEDAAHVLQPYAGIGDVGDATIWSLYKHLPLPDGGLLTVRSNGKMAIELLAQPMAMLDRAAPPARTWIAKRVLQRLAPALTARSRSACPPFDVDPPSVLDEASAMSRTARRMLASAAGRLASVSQQRVINGRALCEAIVSRLGLEPLPCMQNETGVPYRAVFRADSHAQAKDFYAAFTSRGNVVESWPDLPPEIKAAPGRHAAAIELRDTILMMPIHADRRPSELVAAYLSFDSRDLKPGHDVQFLSPKVLGVLAWFWVLGVSIAWLVQFADILPNIMQVVGLSKRIAGS